jgi:hypothetical protein
MDWLLQDWEYEHSRDEIYAMERNHQIELEWQQWEEEQANKTRKPAIIKVLTPIKDEITHISSTVRGTHQKKL